MRFPLLISALLLLLTLTMATSTLAARFQVCGNGTVADTRTGLLWLQNAGCYFTTWDGAIAATKGLASGSCGLKDGSKAGDWRQPTIDELKALISGAETPSWKTDFFGKRNNPNGTAPNMWLKSQGFTDVWASSYWSSTTHSRFPQEAWRMFMGLGNMNIDDKTGNSFVWPIREGMCGK